MERTYKDKYISTSCFQSIFIPANKQIGLFFYCRFFCLYRSIGIFVVIVIVALFHFVVVKLNGGFFLANLEGKRPREHLSLQVWIILKCIFNKKDWKA
jgi:hypothetical protein